MNTYNEFDKPKDLSPNINFNNFKETELKKVNSDFNFSEMMQNASVNETWKNKERIMDFIISCM